MNKKCLRNNSFLLGDLWCWAFPDLNTKSDRCSKTSILRFFFVCRSLQSSSGPWLFGTELIRWQRKCRFSQTWILNQISDLNTKSDRHSKTSILRFFFVCRSIQSSSGPWLFGTELIRWQRKCRWWCNTGTSNGSGVGTTKVSVWYH